MRYITTKFKVLVLSLFFSFNAYADNACLKKVNEKEYYDAKKVCLELAEQEDPLAQFALGTLYYNGFGVMQDYKQSLKWVKKAAINNLPVAQYNLGIMLANAQGTKVDLVEAVAWLKVAKKNDYQEASDVIIQIEEELTSKEKEQLKAAHQAVLKAIK